MPPLNTGQTVSGTVSSIGNKFSFIESLLVAAQFGNKDVFCPSELVQGLEVGDPVEFDLLVNEKGQPQASNVRGPDQAAPSNGSTQYEQLPHESAGDFAARLKGLLTERDEEVRKLRALVGIHAVEPEASSSMVDMSGLEAFSRGLGIASAGEEQSSGTEGISGTITRIGQNYGFIHNPEVHAQFNNDVFCPAAALKGMNVGDTIIFDLTLSSKGQPQAANARAPGAGMNMGMGMGKAMGKAMGKGAMGAAFEPPAKKMKSTLQVLGVCNGAITRIGNQYGFIGNPNVQEQFGNDVFCPAQLLEGMEVGDVVEFDLAINAKGQPQATSVRKSGASTWSAMEAMAGGVEPPGLAGGAAEADMGRLAGFLSEPLQAMPSSGDLVGEVSSSFTGQISRLGAKFAFIVNEEIKMQFGNDVFCPAQALQGMNVGDTVEFDLIQNRNGQPQATNVRAPAQAATGKRKWSW